MSTIEGSHGAGMSEPNSGALPRYMPRKYRLPAKVFHWVTAGLVGFMVASGVTMTQLGGGPVADTLFTLHKTTGICVLAIVILRVLYRLTWPEPTEPHAQYRRTYLHWALYGLVLLMPLLGWSGVSDFDSLGIAFGLTLPPIWPRHAGYGQLLLDLHAYVAFGMLALVALHIAVAMQDHFTRERDTGEGGR